MNKYPSAVFSTLLATAFLSPLQAQNLPDGSIQLVEVVEPRTAVIRFGSNAHSHINLEDQQHNPVSLTEIVNQIPGVVRSGQNGLFQVFSIRGVSGQRVQTRFAGVPISTERRAGTGASFIDPWFIQSVDVVRGPASTFFSSGAIGGVVLSEPRFFAGVEVDLGYESESTQRAQSLGLGNRNWSLGLSRRSAAEGETPTGDPLRTAFDQSSLLLQNRWQLGELQFEGLLLSSAGRDIGRSNKLYPDQRIAEVSKEDHTLLHLGLASEQGWKAELYAHKQFFQNDALIIDLQEQQVKNRSSDWGGRWDLGWKNQAWSGEFGADFDFREGVHADETDIDSNSLEQTFRIALAAAQKTYGLFATTTLDLTRHSIQLGIRQSWLQQTAQGQSRQVDRNFAGYVQWEWFINNNWSISSEVASAYRVPSLSERFFQGSTGRGTSVGNPQLKPETAPGLDFGVHWMSGNSWFSTHWFSQSFENYIERTVIDGETRGFDNLRQGTISGVELEGATEWHDRWSFLYGAHWIEAQGSNHRTIADIPAITTNLSATYSAADWQLGLHWQHRFNKSRAAATEVPIDTAEMINLHYRHRLSNQTTLIIYMKNALNDSYLISSDDISTLGNKRSLGIRFNHRFM